MQTLQLCSAPSWFVSSKALEEFPDGIGECRYACGVPSRRNEYRGLILMHLMSSSAYRRPALLLFIGLSGFLFCWLSRGLPVKVQAAGGVTYYVSNTGSDTNPGTESQPFRTIQKAANIVNPGDTVIVEDGVYTGNNSCSGNSVVVCLTRGGSSTAGVTFKARNRYGARVQGQVGTNNQGWCFLAGANYITIEGFDTYNIAAISATGGASAFALYSGGRFSRLVHNKISLLPDASVR